MRDFLDSKKLKIIICIIAVLIGMMLFSVARGGSSRILGYVFTPIQKASAAVSRSATDFFDTFFNAAAYKKQNEQLEKDLEKYQKQLVDYEEIKGENQRLLEIAGIKEKNNDFQLQPAAVIGRDTMDTFGSFTIDKGTLHGISLYDAVITEAGVVGIINEVNPAFSRVSTVLTPERNIGVYEIKSNDLGIVSGDVKLFDQGLCKMSYIPLESKIAPDDIVVSTGLNGLFPKGLIVGIVQKVDTEPHGTTLYAELKPAVDVKTVKNVFVITDFFGKGFAVDEPETVDGQKK